MLKTLFRCMGRRQRTAKPYSEILRYEEIEPRVLFSADAVPELDSVGMEAPAVVADMDETVQREDSVSTETAALVSEENRVELVIINGDVADAEQLVAGLRAANDSRKIEVVALDATRDGIQQVSEILAGRSDLSAVHFITHGNDGSINLGNTWLNTETLEQFSTAIADWGDALTNSGDILFYGCNIAADSDGQSLINGIAELTGADVAASDDLTGNASLGGDWDLEATVGDVETDVVFTDTFRSQWMGVLNVSDLSSGIELNIDGGNDAYLLANDGGAILGGLSEITFEVSFQMDYREFVALASYATSDTNNNDFVVELRGDGTAKVTINGESTAYVSGINYDTLMDGTIHHLAFSWNNTGAWAIYADGVLTDSGTGLATGQTIRGSVGTGELLFGQEQDTLLGGFVNWQGFTGTLYDVRIWNYVRSDAEIESYYQQKFDSGSLPAGLIANWQMDGFNGSNEVVDVVSVNVSDNNLSIGHATGTDFSTSTPVEDLNIDENSANGTSVGFVVPSDSNPLSGAEFELTDDADGRFAIDISTGEITVADGSGLDYETATSHNITILVTDSDSNSHSESMTIVVNDVDDNAPTVVNQSMTVSEGATDAALTTDDLSSTDADTDDATLIYTVGNVTNGTLTINGSVWASSSNDSFTQQDIIDGKVVYSHDGTNTTSDSFTYSIADPTGNTLSGQTFSITVTAVDDDTPAVVNQSMTVSEGATDVALTTDDLSSTDADTDDATLIYTVSNVTNGTLTINGSVWASSSNDSFTQQDIIDGKVVYSHDGTNTTSDSFTYSIADPTGNTLSGQTFSITVTAVDDDTPTVVNQSMTVSEGATNVALTTDDLSSTDADTDDASLIYTVGNVTNGTLTINGSAWASGTNDSFTQQDIIDGKVIYSHDDTNTTSDSFSYSVADPTGNSLAGQTFSITVTAVDDDTPAVVNQSMTVSEGATNVALTTDDLSSTDADTDDATLIYTVGNVTNGTLTINGSAWASGTNDSFTQQDIIDGKVIYSHDDTNTTSDSFSYSVADPTGNSLAGQTFSITVTAVDDDTPAVVNQSMTVSEGATDVALTTDDLSSTDADTDDATLIYTVGNVTNGTLTINGSAWASGSNDSFTQQDIIDGKVVYSHDGTNTTSDSFSYSVADPTGNTLSGQTFSITITAVDDDAPTVVNQSMTVSEGATDVALTTDDLSSTDADTDDATLIYTVGNVTNGTLTINGSAWASGTNDSFTQQDIIDGKVIYSHDDTNTTSDSFSYSVADPTGNSLAGQTFSITVTAVDDDAPTVVNQSMTVSEGATDVALTTDDLSSTDADTDDASLIYTVGNVTNGTLTINGSAWASGTNDSFTQQDIIDGKVIYSHDDTNTTSDSFSYSVADPTGNSLAGQAFSITVTAVDDDTPAVVNQSMTVSEGATDVALTTDDLSSTDADTDDASLIYTVGNVTNGTLTINGSAWASGTNDSFTQQDIIDGKVIYSHDDTNTTSDSFSYSVADPTGNSLAGQTFSITVTAVDDDTSTVVNQSMTVSEGATDVALTTDDLSSTDADTDDATLIYTVSNVTNGTLTINGSVWASSSNDSFTQQDIIDGKVVYSHDGTNTTSDSFTYSIADPTGNTLSGQTFSITVTAVDDDTPTVVNQSMTVSEGATNVALTTDDLSSTDADTDDASLIYTVGNVTNGTLTINGSAWASGTNDSFTQQDIIDGKVVYSHDGTNTTSDSFSYSVADPTGNTLSGQTFSITITAVDDDAPTVVNQSMTVSEGATDVALTTDDLSSTDADTDDATLIYTVGNVTNGTLTINGSAWASGSNDSFTQQDIIDGKVIYSHDDTNTTSDSFSYSIEDPTGNSLAGQTFSITVTAVDDDAPTVVNQSMTVSEGATNVALTTDDLSSTDADTDDASLIYTVGNVTNGTLTINGSAWASGTNDSFTQQDIIDGKVVYSHDGTNTTSDAFTYSVADPTGNSLTGQAFSITVTAVDDDAPTQVNNTGSTVAEGGTDTISNTELRYDDSEQAASSVSYTVTSGPANGQLELTGNSGVAVTSFTQAQIDAGEVVYVHDGSNTTTDSFTFNVDDSQGNTLAGQTFAFTITAVDDDAPVQVNNTGSTVAEGGTDTITNTELRYDDSEQPASSVSYTVTSGPANGQLELTSNAGISITSFTQSQIDAGEVVYVHDGSNTTIDSFTFNVDDSQGNTLAGQTFAFTITAVDDDAPVQVNNTGSTVAEGGTDTISNTELRYDDSEQPASSVSYTVTNGPANGQLELTGNPGTSITSFTQAQIDASEVVYIHDGSNTTSDSFTFNVDDSQGNTLAGQTFAFTITAVDDDAPVQVNNTGSTVAEGGTDTITNTELRYDDSEQPASSVSYTVTSGPANGQLELTSNAGTSITSFTQAQIDAGEVVYIHDGSNTNSDSFNFSMDDGQGNSLAGQSFAITITAVDDDSPVQVNNTGSTVAEGGTDTISNAELRYDDSEQAASSVSYTVTSGPANGQLELTSNSGVSVSSFTQAQIDASEVVYVHDGSNTTSDSFTFNVDDSQGNTLAGQTFAFTITAVDDDAPVQVNNTGSTVAEGGTDTISNTELRYDDSEQPASSVSYTVTSGPANGQLELTSNAGTSITSFTQAQIDASEVVYIHDGSNTTSDSFTFNVDDSQGNTLAGQTFAFTITAVDDDAPVQVNNTGSTVAEGGTDTITNTELRYDDSEQPASSVSYTVTSGPANGQLELTGNPGTSITSFTQAQIDASEVVYVHDGSNTTSDSFTFNVDDSQGNTLAGQTFAFTITAVDDDAPVQVNNTGSTVAEGGTDSITNTELRYDDSEQAASSVSYTVTSGPANGQLELTGNPGTSITSFTQAQIDAGEVVYIHDGSSSDSFTFSVDDGQGNTLTGQLFSITVTAVDDDAPTVVNQSMTVAEGATNRALTLSDLQSTDADADDTSLIYTVGNVTNGTLTIDGSAWASSTNDSFTQQDIIDGKVVYFHDGTNTTSDSFTYSVADPTGNTLSSQTFSITVTAVDDDAPTVVNQSMTVSEGATDVTLSTDDLSSTDADTDDTSLIYTVSNVTNGTLTINGSAWTSGTNESFTQQDIIDGNVVYTHDGTNTTSDSFAYSVADPTGNTLSGQTFSITVTAVDDDAPIMVNQSMTVSEGATNRTLTLSDLQSTDADTNDTSLIYTVSNVTNGTLTINGSAWASG
ncbi:hypothetical protein DSCO28_23750 [Desulfosarcina ovata subsp. sediminis]|uniref:Uncharacterized protein n=1 Tax=Desulfosarcina ovata subsp. sediminis TaxID=885957 RepID=A0A5K7ZPN8_9BACT|nr:cadherin-like domain-containing protein [Desulfosarcina ovata]BBO81809.1 hypothetical protein DSCO28_23750 [Desulfosarcina ovata subsp. sediminis]